MFFFVKASKTLLNPLFVEGQMGKQVSKGSCFALVIASFISRTANYLLKYSK